ncbi:hypothetical protein CKM354_001105300 [Cercospora kikuchii]|uniref:Uncharacterized protein n=1 Tax=Cercospora kikuchii TaxID=84275 RepID=A0A9P3CS74_9PEZI|nr:uncharacterized protein CKM354_001105300 [Cercospora kikuchii]GIZ47978.1 hypothetical protein CKM354_001105300 [Cercospora kikuchii]
MNHKSYNLIQEEENTEELGLISNELQNRENGGKTSRRTVVLLSVALLILLLVAIVITRWSHIDYHDAPTSPLFEAGEITYYTQRFNGSFFKKTVFRNDAGPEVDAAWEGLGVDYRPMLIPAEKARQAGLKYDQVQLSDKYGGYFIAYFFGIHQLHCLNLLRQALWFNYDYYVQKGEGAFINNATVLKTHVTHCLDMLR